MADDDMNQDINPNDYATKIRINTVLYLCSYYVKDPETFETVMLSYSKFKVTEIGNARDQLRTNVVSVIGAEKVDTKFNETRYKRNTYFTEIKELFELLPPNSGQGFMYVPDPKDSASVIASVPAMVSLATVKSELDTLTKTMSALSSKVNMSISASQGLKLNVPTTNSFAAVAGNSTMPGSNMLSVPVNLNSGLQSSRKRTLSHASNRDRSQSRARRSENRKTGSGGEIKTGVSSAPKHKRAVKIACYKEIEQTDLENWCKTKAELKKYGEYTVEMLFPGKYNHSFRICCNNWPRDAGAFHDESLWPTGCDVAEWNGLILPLSFDNAITKHARDFESSTTEVMVETELKKLYAGKPVEFIVLKQKPAANGDVSFAIKVAQTDKNSKDKPEDLVTQSFQKIGSRVRDWVGVFPRKRNSEPRKKAKLTSVSLSSS